MEKDIIWLDEQIPEFKVGDIVVRKSTCIDLPNHCYGPFKVKGFGKNSLALVRVNPTGFPEFDYGYYNSDFFEKHNNSSFGHGFDEMGLVNWCSKSLVIRKLHKKFTFILKNWWILHSKDALMSSIDMKVHTNKSYTYIELLNDKGYDFGFENFKNLWDKIKNIN